MHLRVAEVHVRHFLAPGEDIFIAHVVLYGSTPGHRDLSDELSRVRVVVAKYEDRVLGFLAVQIREHERELGACPQAVGEHRVSPRHVHASADPSPVLPIEELLQRLHEPCGLLPAGPREQQHGGELVSGPNLLDLENLRRIEAISPREPKCLAHPGIFRRADQQELAEASQSPPLESHRHLVCDPKGLFGAHREYPGFQRRLHHLSDDVPLVFRRGDDDAVPLSPGLRLDTAGREGRGGDRESGEESNLRHEDQA